MALCDGNQGRLSKVMERRSDPVLPYSLSDADWASSFSDFFSENIMRIRRELDSDLFPWVFSVDFDACPMIKTISPRNSR